MSSIRFRGADASSRSTARALLLVAALLLAQWVGMLHRIEHAFGSGESQAQSLWGSAYAVNPSISHSCVVFDGAYLADLLPTALVDFVAARMDHGLPPAIDFASWSGRFVGHFQPRAPPAA